MITISATRIHGTNSTPGRDCGRCGLTFIPGHNTEGSRAHYCSDCRPEATRLGWCMPRAQAGHLISA